MVRRAAGPPTARTPPLSPSRFLDFISALMARLTAAPPPGGAHPELRVAAQAAYDVALAPHHPWILRTTIGGAMYFLPHRAAFLAALGAGMPPAELEPALAAFVGKVDPVRDELWRHYKALGLQELP